MHNISGQELTLDRYPAKQKNRSLQAWDSADEYIIKHWQEQQLNYSKPLIINDSFGALACAFHHLKPVSFFDSYVSYLGTVQNLGLNDLDEAMVDSIDSISKWPEDIDVVILKLPKSNRMLEYILQRITTLAPNTPVIAAGKAKDVTSSIMKLFERYLDNVKSSLAVKKSRLIMATAPEEALPEIPLRTWKVKSKGFVIANHANVFSANALDIGGAFLLDHIPTEQTGKIIDLGCGNGIIGAAALKSNPDATVVFTDESYMAIESSKLNVEKNMSGALERATFLVDDCLTTQEKESADWVLCNPPFHQQQAVTDHIAWQMLKDSHRVLKRGGTLRIVGNRHLAYPAMLKRLFANCIVHTSNPKFVILDARKR